jgi:hypothetical protein
LLSTGDQTPVRVPRQAITQLDVSTGRHGHALKGMIIGAASAAALFALIPRDQYCADLRPGEYCPTQAELAGLGAIGGAAWGALIGHLIKSDRWSSVPLEQVHVSLAPALGRGAVGLSLAVGW